MHKMATAITCGRAFPGRAPVVDTGAVDELFELLLDATPFGWLLGAFDDWGFRGDPFEAGPSVAELQKAIARENARRKVTQLARLERDRQTGRLSLPDFRRRYARLAGRDPDGDPAHTDGPYGPNSVAVAAFLDRAGAMGAADWDQAEEHLGNLPAKAVVRKAVLPRYRAALDAAVGAAHLTATAAAAEALQASVPESRHETWRLMLCWLPIVLVTDARAASASIATPLGAPPAG
jgi:hypothetical protein